MTETARPLGPATVRWSDYVGTAAADDAAAVIGSPSLYELAGVDRGRYTIVGIDIEVEDDTAVTVYAVDRLTLGVANMADIDKLGWATGRLSVVAFRVPDSDTDAFLYDAFRRISIRLLAREVRDQVLSLTLAE